MANTVPIKRQKSFIEKILPQTHYKPHFETKERATAIAHVNIALSKYWGKRDRELNLPMTNSLSLSVTPKTCTTVSSESEHDVIILNGEYLKNTSPLFQRIWHFLEIIRPHPAFFFRIETDNDWPTAAGVASSASGFAALTLALDMFFRWSLPRKELSMIARLGSGSAARSCFCGFVEWHAGNHPDESFAEVLPDRWDTLRLGLLLADASTEQKKISSSDAMEHTTRTSILHKTWPKQVEHDLFEIRQAIREQDFDRLGIAAERNALCMHATMLSASPSILYWRPETISHLKNVWRLRDQGLPIYATIDAGPHVKVLFEEPHTEAVRSAFLDIDIVAPIFESDVILR